MAYLSEELNNMQLGTEGHKVRALTLIWVLQEPFRTKHQTINWAIKAKELWNFGIFCIH